MTAGDQAPPIPISLVAAVAENGVIGIAGGLPWRVKADLKRFRAITMGKPLVMGRKTFESIGRVLDGRDVIVVTRQRDFAAAGVLVAGDLAAAFALAEACARQRGADEICVVGGGEIYEQALPRAALLRLTHVAVSPKGDVFFPRFDPDAWVEVSREVLAPSAGDTAAAVHAVYERR